MTSRANRLRIIAMMNLRETLRDKVAAFFSFFFPLMFAVIFGISSSQSATPQVKVALLNPANDPAATPFVSAMRSQPLVKVVDHVGAVSGAQPTLPASVQALLVWQPASGTQPATVHIVAGPQTSKTLKTAVDAARGTLLSASASERTPFQVRVEAPVKKAPSNFTFTMPGLMAMALLQLGLFATATPLIIARDNGTLRHLSTTPASKIELAVAHVGLRFAIAIFQIGLLLAVSNAFGLSLRGSIGQFALVVALGALMFIAIGYALAGVVPGKEAGVGIILLVNFAMLFLGQIFFSLSGSGVLRTITRLLPVTYLSDGLRQTILAQPGQLSVGINCLAMALWLVLAMAAAAKTFRFDTRKA